MAASRLSPAAISEWIRSSSESLRKRSSCVHTKCQRAFFVCRVEVGTHVMGTAGREEGETCDLQWV